MLWFPSCHTPGVTLVKQTCLSGPQLLYLQNNQQLPPRTLPQAATTGKKAAGPQAAGGSAQLCCRTASSQQLGRDFRSALNTPLPAAGGGLLSTCRELQLLMPLSWDLDLCVRLQLWLSGAVGIVIRSRTHKVLHPYP